MRGKYQRILARILAVFTAFLVIFTSSLAYSQDSVSGGLRSCASDPVCRVSLIQHAKDLGVANNIVPISRNIGARVLGSGGAQISSQSAAVSAAVPAGSGASVAQVIISGIPVIGGALAAFFFGVAQIESLQNEAKKEYCLANPNALVCGAISAQIQRHPNSGAPFLTNGGARYALVPPLVFSRPTTYEMYVYDSKGRYLTLYDPTQNQEDTLVDIQQNPSLPWEQWSPQEREGAIGLVPDSFLSNLISSLPSSSLISSIPSGAASVEVSGANYHLVPDGKGGYKLVPIGSPYNIPVPNSLPDFDGDGIPDQDDPDDDNDGDPDTSDPEPKNKFVNSQNPAPNPNPSPAPSPNPNSSPPPPPPPPPPDPKPSSPPEVTGEVPGQPKVAEFSKPNFLTYALTVFSEKFPLDVMGELPSGQGTDDCPRLTFWGEDFEVCIVRDFLKMLKIPIVISFIIWAILAL
jgi:hypothetical protein